MLEQHEGWRKPHWREESGLHQERKKACKVGTKEMVRAPDKEDKEQAGASSGESGDKKVP